jgi:dTDP-4-amino-4,6-dideoxygalactose transaminase
MLRNHGQDPASLPSDFVMAGLNQRLTELQAALGRTQLRKLSTMIASRRSQAAAYQELFAGSSIQAPVTRAASTHVYQSYVVLIPEHRAPQRNDIIRVLRESGIEASIGTHHIPLLRFYRETFGYAPGDFPVADLVAGRAIALPLHPYLSAQEQVKVAEVLMAVTQ